MCSILEGEKNWDIEECNWRNFSYGLSLVTLHKKGKEYLSFDCYHEIYMYLTIACLLIIYNLM